ncbi:MAG: hypothetical protein COZ69_04115 [Deltaproteobacteria bacterium CG_4_8_14_3_um_filter_45_9]|nr:MAG: hypothetical protein COS40_13515 [Deltaproteobacteria bacterium CG03_land_8_20_14_0_80_45_14]PIX25153.1 MAG: hypothetical protein COZ69_04115 [Deltaproteobacteria bacterium CG_4_8_14_3_um_filter_45_9]
MAVEGNEATLDTVNVYLKQLQETVERIREQFLEPVLRQREAFQQWMQPIIEAQNALQETLEPILAEQKRWKNVVESIQISKYTLPDISQIVQPSLEFQKSIQGLITPAFEQLQESFRRLPPRTQEAVLLLGEHGWYLDLEMPIPGLWELKKALSEGNVEEAEEALAEYFTGRLDEIEASIIERFPNRQKMIRAAFNAHRRQEYELSIPVFLAQTDGICKEVIKQYLFIKQNRKPRTAIYVEQIASNTFRAALLQPLAHPLPIAASERERAKGFNELNRHMVLHGESLDYGTQINSLKAISLINYVARVLTLDDKNP